MVPEQWDRRSKLVALSHRARTPRQSSTWERGKIGQRRRIHTQKTKTITIIDTQIQITTSTSRRVEVKPTFGAWPGRSTMYACRCSLPCTCSSAHVTHLQLICCCWLQLCRLKPISWVEGQCCYWQWVAEQRSRDPECLHERRPEEETSARRSKKTFGLHGVVRAYGKDSTKRRQLWGSFRRFE